MELGAVRFQYVPLLPLLRDPGPFNSLRGATFPEGGVNGRKPSRLPAGADCVGARCGSMFREPGFDDPIFIRSELPGVVVRVLLLGGENGRDTPRFPFCIVDGWLPTPRFIELPVSLPPWKVPALGFCIEPEAVLPRNPAD